MHAWRFGVSTHLFHEQRLAREHLVGIASHGFEAVELFATRSHFDYRSAPAVADLGTWLGDAGLELHSMHAPIVEAMVGGRWVGALSNASADESRRRAAVAETEAALAVARQVPFRFLVVHLGLPTTERVAPGDNRADAARRSIEEIAGIAARVGVKVALEVIPNALAAADELRRLIEDDLDGFDVGVCLDYGHAHLMGDLADAVEALSGHVWTTHVHDNDGQLDQHLVPFAGTIDWHTALMATQKIGYDGPLMLEVAGVPDSRDALRRSAGARARLERALATP
jgi:sugar phosphate isomerase/epimerase